MENWKVIMEEFSQNNTSSSGQQHRKVLGTVSLRSYCKATRRYWRQAGPKANERALLKILTFSRLSRESHLGQGAPEKQN